MGAKYTFALVVVAVGMLLFMGLLHLLWAGIEGAVRASKGGNEGD